MLCIDLLREISKYLTVKECLDMEVSIGEKIYTTEEYKNKIKHKIYKMNCGHFKIKAFFDIKFKCDINTNDHKICTVSMYNVDNTKEACLKAISLFKLDYFNSTTT